jgi:MoaA/NifB/PqqE/SkfB family radical SAM enzyme
MKVKWFITEECNLKCPGCFRQRNLGKAGRKEIIKVAEYLADQAERVTVGGGEPLLEKTLEVALEILRKGKVYVSLHSNGILLSQDEVYQRIIPRINLLSLPLDSPILKESASLRGWSFNTQLYDLSARLLREDVRVGFKTLATPVNSDSIPKLHPFISAMNLEYWKVYQFRKLNGAKSFHNFEITNSIF